MIIEKKHRLPFALVTSLFLLWGLANNMTDTLLAAFKKITHGKSFSGGTWRLNIPNTYKPVGG